MLHAQETLDVQYEHLGWQAMATPAVGNPFGVRVLPDGDPEEISGFRQDTARRRESLTLRVRVSEWPQEPKDKVDLIIFTGAGDSPSMPPFLQGQRRRVTDHRHRDPLRLEWLIDTEAVQ